MNLLTPHTFTLVRLFTKPPEAVFAAFSDPAKKKRWMADGHNHQVDHYQADFRVGGKDIGQYRLADTTPFPGVAMTSEETYLDIAQNERIVSASTMTLGGKLISAALASFEIEPHGDGGAKLTFTHQALFYPISDGPEMRQDGWKKLLDRLHDTVHG